MGIGLDLLYADPNLTDEQKNAIAKKAMDEAVVEARRNGHCNPHVQVLVGMIAAGKSTYALNAARAGFIVINDDSLTASVHGGDYSLYQKNNKTLYKAVGVSIFTHAIAMKRPVVVDTGSRNRITRSRWISLAKSLDVPVYGVGFTVDEVGVHAKRRYDSDSRGYTYEKWLEVTERHAAEFEPLDSDEGFDRIVFPKWEQVRDGWYYQQGEK